MHEDRDSYIILITLLPLVLFIGLYATWRSAGEPGIDVPNLPLPAIPLPTLPDLTQYLPPWLMTWVRNLQRNADSVFPAIALGVFVGLVGMGTLADAMKKLWSYFAVVPDPHDSPSSADSGSPDFNPPEPSSHDRVYSSPR